jgi:hypothetical protein
MVRKMRAASRTRIADSLESSVHADWGIRTGESGEALEGDPAGADGDEGGGGGDEPEDDGLKEWADADAGERVAV